jgi:hypothetical protein
MAERIRVAGERGISKSELTKAFQHVKQREREERLRTLIDSGRVQVIERKTSGRTAHIYVDASLGATNLPGQQDE